MSLLLQPWELRTFAQNCISAHFISCFEMKSHEVISSPEFLATFLSKPPRVRGSQVCTLCPLILHFLPQGPLLGSSS